MQVMLMQKGKISFQRTVMEDVLVVSRGEDDLLLCKVAGAV